MLKNWIKSFRKNPLDALLERAKANGHKRFLIPWNRGMGDVPLGLFALICRIKEAIPECSITFLTRKDLKEVFEMLDGANVLVCPNWRRGEDYVIEHSLRTSYDCIIENVDPTRWLSAQLGTLIPRLKWEDRFDALIERFNVPKSKLCLGVHVQTETDHFYGYEKNWPVKKFLELFERLGDEGTVLLFGLKKTPPIIRGNILDLRGETSLFEMLSLIKNCCTHLLAPDSGVLSVMYYVDAQFPLRLISLWSDPRQGVLRQNVPSPNKQLEHCPIVASQENIGNISIEQVYGVITNETCNIGFNSKYNKCIDGN